MHELDCGLLAIEKTLESDLKSATKYIRTPSSRRERRNSVVTKK